jgi:hypothetical protein
MFQVTDDGGEPLSNRLATVTRRGRSSPVSGNRCELEGCDVGAQPYGDGVQIRGGGT